MTTKVNYSKILILLMLSCVFSSYCYSTVTLPAHAARKKCSYELGLLNYQKGRFDRALLLFYKHIKAHPKDVKAYYHAAITSQRLRDFERARVLYRRILLLDPTSKYGQRAKNKLANLSPKKKSNVASSAKRTRSSSSRASRSQRPRSNDTLPKQTRVFFKSKNTQMIVDGRINGKPIKMLFDTGAPAAGYFSIGHLRQLGLQKPVTPALGKMGGSSNTKKVDYWKYKVNMQVGSIVRHKIPVFILDNERDTPLLGQEFFKDYTYTIDYGGKSILFTKNQNQSTYSAPSRYSVPFRFRKRGNRIVVDLDIDGKKVPAMFDTGHTNKAVLSIKGRSQARKYGIRIPANAPSATTGGVTGWGTSRVVTVRRVKLGPIEKYNARIHVSDVDQGLDKLPLLGQAFYSGWQYTIDMNKKLIHFKRR